jgi:hypothetical protein
MVFDACVALTRMRNGSRHETQLRTRGGAFALRAFALRALLLHRPRGPSSGLASADVRVVKELPRQRLVSRSTFSCRDELSPKILLGRCHLLTLGESVAIALFLSLVRLLVVEGFGPQPLAPKRRTSASAEPGISTA